MIWNYLPLPAEHNAPPIIRALRMTFDTQLMSIHETALTMHAADPGSPTKMFHVPFTHEQFEVEAMYDAQQDLFTQLVARPASDQYSERPAYTISLFLVADVPHAPSSL